MKDRLYKIILSPHISEKSSNCADINRQIVFKVRTDSTKDEIKDAVEMMFKVHVVSVQTSLLKGKRKKFKGKLGKRNNIKKAYVKLSPGEDIDFSGAS